MLALQAHLRLLEAQGAAAGGEGLAGAGRLMRPCVAFKPGLFGEGVSASEVNIEASGAACRWLAPATRPPGCLCLSSAQLGGGWLGGE